MKHLLQTLFLLAIFSCQKPNTTITANEFKDLMNRVAEGWSTQNIDLALSSFTVDAVYMEPPNVQYFRGHEQLRPYFSELTERHEMVFHNLWFDKQTQSGVGEFTFSYGSDTATVGVVVVELDHGKITFWREYLQVGPVDFDEFLSIENKTWRWHIGNYPEPQDSIK